MMEKRIHQRAPVELAASYGIPNAEELTDEATVINISKGGFCFCSEQSIDAGTDIKLTVDLEKGEKIEIEVQSIWCQQTEGSDGYIVGVKITNPENPNFDKFLDFYAKRVKEVQDEV